MPLEEAKFLNDLFEFCKSFFIAHQFQLLLRNSKNWKLKKMG